MIGNQNEIKQSRRCSIQDNFFLFGKFYSINFSALNLWAHREGRIQHWCQFLFDFSTQIGIVYFQWTTAPEKRKTNISKIRKCIFWWPSSISLARLKWEDIDEIKMLTANKNRFAFIYNTKYLRIKNTFVVNKKKLFFWV